MQGPRNPAIVIPARLAATRLPGKPLVDIAGEPMIVHIWRHACAARLGPVYVACAEAEVADVITAAGGTAVLTRANHASGSDRIFEALRRIDPEARHDAVVNVQGDMPELDVTLPRAALALLADPEVDIATLACPIAEVAERDDPNVVKAVVTGGGAHGGRALYFSRAAVPWGDGPLYHHIGLYAFRRAALERFVTLPPALLERREGLEQLRALEAGMHIAVGLVDRAPLEVNTRADLRRARELLGAGA